MSKSKSKSNQPPAPMSSPSRDLSQLKSNAGDSAAELRAFLAEIKGKSPKEMLGAIASASLFQSLVQACILTAILIAVFTVFPFAWGKVTGGEEEVADPDAAAEEQAAEPGTEETDPAATAAAGQDPATPQPATPTEGEASTTPEPGIAETLGIGETKIVPLDVNPLDGAEDDLLKGLE